VRVDAISLGDAAAASLDAWPRPAAAASSTHRRRRAVQCLPAGRERARQPARGQGDCSAGARGRLGHCGRRRVAGRSRSATPRRCRSVAPAAARPTTTAYGPRPASPSRFASSTKETRPFAAAALAVGLAALLVSPWSPCRRRRPRGPRRAAAVDLHADRPAARQDGGAQHAR
jgi:hypothetical protein